MKENQIYFEYLQYIRGQGIKNVVGASIWLQRKFNLSHEEAKRIIGEWNKLHSFTK